MSERMTLDEFIAEELARLDRFKADWLKNAAAQPDIFTPTMAPSDWDEALQCFTDPVDDAEPEGAEP